MERSGELSKKASGGDYKGSRHDHNRRGENIMSVNAYRVNKVQRAKSPTFNLWHDKALMEFIDSNSDFMSGLNNDGNGMSDVPVEVLEKIVAKLNLDADIVKALKRDIAWAKRHGEQNVTYDCF
jgi:hypothetical protein